MTAIPRLLDKRLLVVEDDPDITDLLRLHLTPVVGTLGIERDGRAGLEQARSGNWDMLLLDLRLPGMSGLDVCRTLRAEGNAIPLVMLTARSAELDRVLGLDLGADDYITKPFSIIELVARIRAHLRRADRPQSPASGTICVGPVSMDPESRQVRVNERPVDLTAREFDLLAHFARNPGRVFKRSQLLDDVWGYGHEGYEHTVNAHINRLRAKIEDEPRRPKLITTVWGVGYRFETEGEL